MGLLNIIKKSKETDVTNFRDVYIYAKIGDKITIKEDISNLSESEFKDLVDDLSFHCPCKVHKISHDSNYHIASLTKV
ncbi:MAG: hypothetical protein K6G11_01335 [Lachnospiraceae bacterium]|nr:hypothetical protein [Lachnospiraceae bacterium]